jgi:hypothetical protein
MDRACSKNVGKIGTHIGYRLERRKERDHWEVQEVDGWMMLKWILERQDEVVWIGLIFLWIGSGGGLL